MCFRPLRFLKLCTDGALRAFRGGDGISEDGVSKYRYGAGIHRGSYSISVFGVAMFRSEGLLVLQMIGEG